MRRDLACGALGLALAALYWIGASRLPTSFLSDSVGADGLPKALALVLAVLSVAIALRASKGDQPPRPARALGIAALGFLHVLVVPYIGYLAATTLLAAGAALYYGAPRRWPVALFGFGTAALLWLAFDLLLGVALP